MAYKHLLVPFDGSALAEAALSFAAWLGWKGGAEVDLVRAVPDHPPLSIRPLAGMLPPPEHLVQAKNAMALEAVRLRERGIRATGGAFLGQPASVMLSYIEQYDIDLVVMGTHGRPLLGQWLLGSVASELARCAPIPVILLPRHCTPAHDDALRLLVALDESPIAESALGAVLELAATVPAEITLMQVFPGAGPSPEKKTPEWYRLPVLGTSHYLDGIQRRLAKRGSHVDCAYSAGSAGEEILLFAERAKVDVIAIGTRGLAGFDRLLWGSVAEFVVQRAHVPVLLTSRATASARRDSRGPSAKARSNRGSAKASVPG